jgi:serine protease Do
VVFDLPHERGFLALPAAYPRSQEMYRKRSEVRGRTWLSFVATLALVSVLTVAAGTMLNLAGGGNSAHGAPWYADSPSASSAAPASQPTAGKEQADNPALYAKALSKAFHNAASEVLPAVVTITNSPKAAKQDEEEESTPNGNPNQIPPQFKGTPFEDMFKNDPHLRFFFNGRPMPQMPRQGATSFGSGVIVDQSGIVLTNNHVVAGGGDITVALPDGREFKAVDIKTDPKSDLAVLRLKGASNLPAARLGNSDKIEIGDWVVALGQPFKLPGTVTAGIISAKGRAVDIQNSGQKDFLQTDAAINPGNSGGPLVNLDGEVVGINTAIASNVGAYQGVGFAIPINLAKWVGGQLMTAGKVQRAYLGVGLQPMTQSLAEKFGVNVNQGVLVAQVFPDTPAAKAGVKSGDVVVGFDGKKVSSPQELQSLVEAVKPGKTGLLAFVRDGKRTTLAVKCAEMPASYGIAGTGSEQNPKNAEPSRFEKLGIRVQDLTPALAEQLGVKAEHGVVITDVRSGSPAERDGLAAGMVISEVNRRPVKSVEDFRKALAGASLEKGVLLYVQSAQGGRFVDIIVAEPK